jgi:hypothetical protein
MNPFDNPYVNRNTHTHDECGNRNPLSTLTNSILGMGDQRNVAPQATRYVATNPFDQEESPFDRASRINVMNEAWREENPFERIARNNVMDEAWRESSQRINALAGHLNQPRRLPQPPQSPRPQQLSRSPMGHDDSLSIKLQVVDIIRSNPELDPLNDDISIFEQLGAFNQFVGYDPRLYLAYLNIYAGMYMTEDRFDTILYFLRSIMGSGDYEGVDLIVLNDVDENISDEQFAELLNIISSNGHNMNDVYNNYPMHDIDETKKSMLNRLLESLMRARI